MKKDIRQDKLVIDICSKCGEPVAYITKPKVFYYGELCWRCLDKRKEIAYERYKEVRRIGYEGQRHLRDYNLTHNEYKDSEVLILPTDYDVYFKAQLLV